MNIENDREIFAAGYPAIVPFLMEEYRGNTEFEIYAGIEKTALLFEQEFAGRFFSEKALRWIGSALDAYIEENGYKRDRKGETLFYNSYELRSNEAVNRSLILPETVLLQESHLGKAKNLTTFSLEELIEKQLVTFVTLCNGEVVSIATVNETLEETAMLEVTVETAVKHRGKGYALSCVAALADYLTRRGVSLAYCCRNTHSKSNKIARHVGFEKVGRFYAVSAYRVRRA